MVQHCTGRNENVLRTVRFDGTRQKWQYRRISVNWLNFHTQFPPPLCIQTNSHKLWIVQCIFCIKNTNINWTMRHKKILHEIQLSPVLMKSHKWTPKRLKRTHPSPKAVYLETSVSVKWRKLLLLGIAVHFSMVKQDMCVKPVFFHFKKVLVLRSTNQWNTIDPMQAVCSVLVYTASSRTSKGKEECTRRYNI